MIYRFLLLVMLITVGFPRPLKAEVTTDGAILIITSYNPETRSISDNLSAFMDEYKLRGGKRLITIESMNCKKTCPRHTCGKNVWLLSLKNVNVLRHLR